MQGSAHLFAARMQVHVSASSLTLRRAAEHGLLQNRPACFTCLARDMHMLVASAKGLEVQGLRVLTHMEAKKWGRDSPSSTCLLRYLDTCRCSALRLA